MGIVYSLDTVAGLNYKGIIEEDIISKAKRNPRNLFLLGNYMIQFRCEQIKSMAI